MQCGGKKQYKNGREEINFSCIGQKYNDLNPRKLIHLYGTLQKQVFFQIVSPLAFLWDNMLGTP